VDKEKLTQALIPLIGDALSGDPEVARIESASQFFFKGTGMLTLSHAEAEKLREAAFLISQQFPTVGADTCTRELKRFCCRFIPQLKTGVQRASIAAALPELLDCLDSFGQDLTTIYIEVCGLGLQLTEWKFGSARFLRGNHPEIEAEHSQIVTADGHKPKPLRAEQVVAQIKLHGEVKYAQDEAFTRTNQILDTIQFLSLNENPGSWDPDGLCFGLYCCQPIPMITSNSWYFTSRGPTWGELQGVPPIIPTIAGIKCVINSQTNSQFSERGGKGLNALLSETNRSAFDENLLTAIGWIANAIRERNLARKYLGFYVALEALFSRDKLILRDKNTFQKAIFPIPEAVAFFIGRGCEGRRKLCSEVNDLAKTRNRIAHRGYTDIDEAELRAVGSHAWSCCWQAAERRDQFREDDSFRDWLLNLKFGNADLI